MLSNSYSTPAINSKTIQLIENQLKKILVSKYFKSAKKMRSFLKYVVEKTIAEEGNSLKQYTIGIDVLLLGDDFDPEENPAVRILGGRVRRRLEQYYEIDRSDDEIIIIMSKGSYIPQFKMIEDNKNENLPCSKGPILALVSFTDESQSSDTNRVLLECTDTLATKLSRFLYLQLVIFNPYGDKTQSHRLDGVMRSTNKAEYNLVLFLQKLDEADRYSLIYRIVLIETGEILWSDSYVIFGISSNEKKHILGKLTATVGDHLQGVIHTHWSRKLLANINKVPRHNQVLVYFRNYIDRIERRSFIKGVKSTLRALRNNTNDVIASVIYAEYCIHEYIFSYGIIESPLEKGKKCIESAIKIGSNISESRYIYGLILFHQKEWSLSIEQFKLARSICSYNTIIEFGVGFHLCKMNQWDEGLDQVNKTMLLSNTYPSIYHLVPFLDFYRTGNYEQALSEAKKITITGLVYAPLARCVSYAQLGKLEEADKEFKEVLKRYPEFMNTGRKHLSRFLGNEILAKTIWEGILKVRNG